MAHWFYSIHIFEVCAWEPEFEGGGWMKKPWWQQEDPDEVSRAMLEEASREAWLRHRLRDTPQVETGRGVGRYMHLNSR